MRRLVVAALLVSIGLIPVVASAQSAPSAITIVSLFKAQPGKGDTLVDLFKKYDKPVVDKLLADGTIVDWGIGVPYIHTGSDWTHAFWITAADWAHHAMVDKAFEASEKARKEDENKKIDEALRAALVPDTHRDLVFRNVVAHSAPRGTGGSGKAYLWLADYQAKPGKDDEAVGIYRSAIEPVFAKLLADGTLRSYGVQVPVVHSEITPVGSLSFWYEVGDLADLDKVQGALRAARESRSREQNAAAELLFDQVFAAGHHDSIVEIQMSGSK
ncbi:MAG TPA: hypothetical protein VLW17_04725 [Thermoanaerobaculaceae bacterium]|nr:hypothetical protein [Thermoanaerobaculaceae bacterium]